MRHSPSLITSPAHSHPPRPLLSPHQPALSQPVMAISSRPLRCLSAFLSSISHTQQKQTLSHTPLHPPCMRCSSPLANHKRGTRKGGVKQHLPFPSPSLSLTASHLHTNAPPYLPSAARGALHRRRKTPEVAAHSTLQPLPLPTTGTPCKEEKKRLHGFNLSAG